MSRKEQQHGGVKLTAKTARTLAMREFGIAENRVYMDKQSGKDFERKITSD